MTSDKHVILTIIGFFDAAQVSNFEFIKCIMRSFQLYEDSVTITSKPFFKIFKPYIFRTY